MVELLKSVTLVENLYDIMEYRDRDSTTVAYLDDNEIECQISLKYYNRFILCGYDGILYYVHIDSNGSILWYNVDQLVRDIMYYDINYKCDSNHRSYFRNM